MRVDFYLLSSSTKQAAFDFSCRLLEKAYLRNEAVFVWCDTEDDAQTLDKLLWTFKETSFIPHLLYEEVSDDAQIPIQIGTQAVRPEHKPILLNLRQDIPALANGFKRILEVVLNEADAKQSARQRYRAYRDARCELHTHTPLVPVDAS